METEIQQNWSLPPPIYSCSKRYFSPEDIQEAQKILEHAKINISFSKGNPDSYFICSGIIKEDQHHEAKVIFKKRLEDTPGGPLSSSCDCYRWSEKKHCPHTCALFLNFYLNLNTTQSSAFTSSLGVTPVKYGTIVEGPQFLQGTPVNPTYSSIQYLLQDKRLTPFPIPENFEGRLILDINSKKIPLVTMKYRDTSDQVIEEISIFENLYLFNWRNGKAWHLERELKDLIQKIRIYSTALSVNELIEITAEARESSSVEVLIDQMPLNEIPVQTPSCQIHIMKGAHKGQIRMNIMFQDQDGDTMPLPEFLRAFTFTGGLLSTFKSKSNAYEFIDSFCPNSDENHEDYKKTLLTSSKRNEWADLISTIKTLPFVQLYSSSKKALLHYDCLFLLTLVSNLHKYFSKTFFRFSESDINHVTYKTTNSLLFTGLADFYEAMAPYRIPFYYDTKQVGPWSSKIRFERKSSTIEWFDLELEVSDNDMEIVRNFDMDNKLAQTSHGLILLTKEQNNLLKFIKKYTDYEKISQDKYKDDETGEGFQKFVLPFNKARIFELFELKKLGLDGALTEEELALCERLTDMKEMPTYDIPKNLVKVLRPYQKNGHHWLNFLYENRLGACLADDMGLGKTLQAISFIKHIYEKVNSILIVCPVTILLNWEKEFVKFSDIPVHIYHGEGRVYPTEHKITLTSYGIMKKEVATTFRDTHVDILILDEVQHLKNINSLGAQTARKIKADFRITLTGTPVENDLAEFYNILDLSIPGIWGNLSFIRTASTPKSRLLARKTASPFILRRTKKQVLNELPPKIENNVLLSFSEGEQENYRNSLDAIKKRIASSNPRNKYGEILKSLLELRQKCLWQTLSKQPRNNYDHITSTKIHFLIETLEQIIDEGHQAIIFSQFTTYLDIIQHHLKPHLWKMARIDGSQAIKTRQQQVDLFQGGKCPVFLISLKAGGVGLNLTAASYVFVMDPWWNPSVEQQAIDRAHRIGQKNKLTVYRPIIENSVEEKVLELQKIKRELFQELLPEDDGNLFTGKLTVADFESFLS